MGAGPGGVPLSEEDVSSIAHALRTDRAVESVGNRVDSAWLGAVGAVSCFVRRSGIEPAQKALRRGEIEKALALARAFRRHAGDDACPTSVGESAEGFDSVEDERRRASLLEANALLQLERPEPALEALDGVEPDRTPIPDYVHWLRGRALRAAGEAGGAAEAFGAIYRDESTPLRYRARVRQAMALAEADRPAEALPILEEMLDLFPDYPRRFRLLFERARALEQLGRFYEAAEAYQSTWFEFPHKAAGSRALARKEALAARGYEAPTLSRRKLFDRYRQLRINKHWDLAESLFQRLLEREKTPHGHSGFEHEILMQLALNAFVPKRNEKALQYLKQLRNAWSSGYRDSIQIDLVDKYLTRTLSRMGRYEEALAAIESKLARKNSYTRKSELLDFFREHGRYEKAHALANSHYSKYQKRRWPYTWLLYKTGRLEEAIEGFEYLAKRRSGRSKAKALYWKARSHGRLGEHEEARKTYEGVATRYSTSYYGIQAVNRLHDLKRRSAIEGLFVDQAGPVMDSGEELFTAFDEAARRADGTRREPAADRSLVPRHVADDGSVNATPEITSAACEAGSDADRAFCRLMMGEIPEQTIGVIERAVSPFGALADFDGEDGNGHAMNARTPGGGGTGRNGGATHEEPDWSADVTSLSENTPPDAKNRVQFQRSARIHWKGRDDSEVAFERFSNGHVVGPVPGPVRAYGDDSHVGGVRAAAERAGDLFPSLVRTRWLHEIGLVKEARRAIRDAVLEFRAITDRHRPANGRPHELPHERWTYLIDFRRYDEGFWGYTGDSVKRYPVPDSWKGRRKLAKRQQKIWDRRRKLQPLFIDAMKEVGDYHLVRKFTLEKGGWYNRDPSGPTADLWRQAYPRAFPRKVVAESREHGINPYLIWALMTVESSYNPDSISHADAIGLLQVIPRTGIKVARWIGDEEFGPYDLIDEDVAIEHGVYYFSSLVRKFRGQELLAAAGYNGGPHRVAAWLKKRGSSMPHDEFVEEIPFDQARLYVKKVTRFLNLYMRLYEDRNRLYIGQNLDTDYRAQPNF